MTDNNKKDLMVPETEEKEVFKNIDIVSNELLLTFLDTFSGAKELLKEEKIQFLQIAKAFNLNPFKKEIYMIAYGKGEYRTCSIITGYEVYLKRAERTGLLAGWNVKTTGDTPNTMKAHITIHRKDRQYPFEHEVDFLEFAGKKKEGDLNAFWKKQPRFQLKKVAISQGFRLCFPDELGGMPYTEEELSGEIINITPDVKEIDTPGISADETMNKLKSKEVKKTENKGGDLL